MRASGPRNSASRASLGATVPKSKTPAAKSTNLSRPFLTSSLNDQEAMAVVPPPVQQRADAAEKRRAQAKVAGGLTRFATAIGDQAAEEVDGCDAERELREEGPQGRTVARAGGA